MEHSQDLKKYFANHVARVASSEDVVNAVRLLRAAGLIAEPSGEGSSRPPLAEADGSADSSKAPAPEQVGIWERRGSTSPFVRRADLAEEWGFWANVRTIPPKTKKSRVVLIGESAARGYLYDPQFTPAMALERALQSELGVDSVEVVDLARTSLEFIALKKLAADALLLSPDIVVIFAGNNWGPSLPVDFLRENMVQVHSILRTRGIAGLRHILEEHLAADATALMSNIAQSYHAKNVSLIWVVPESNLDDWRDPAIQAPYLVGDANQEWLSCWNLARVALEQNELKVASEMARKMVDLDQGVCVSGLYILAEASRRVGNLNEAKNYLECARDALIWDPSKTTPPRPYSVIQDTLRDQACRHGHALIDLPKIFAEYLNGGLPGRRLFLDYCHMSAEGIRVFVAATAARIVSQLRGEDVSWPALISKVSEPTNKIKAEAAFLAAVHNSHWGQSYELTYYYCREALRLAPRIAEAMACLIDLQTQQAPMVLCRSAQELATLDWPSIQYYLLRYRNQTQRLDRNLMSAILDSLQAQGVPVKRDISRTGRQGAEKALGVDLLDYYYCSAALQPQEVVWVTPGRFAQNQSHYYKAYSRESKFVFPGTPEEETLLTLTCRLSGAGPASADISIAVNNTQEARLKVTSSWSTWDIIVPRNTLIQGLNDVTIHWPTPEFYSEKALQKAADDVLQGTLPEFYCIHGEAHSFTARSLRHGQNGDSRRWMLRTANGEKVTTSGNNLASVTR